MKTELNYCPVYRFDAPEWYKREDFMDWLRGKRHMRPATWHQPDDDKAYEDSDAFCTWDSGDGSDMPTGNGVGIPADIWKAISEKLRGQPYGIIWISNGVL